MKLDTIQDVLAEQIEDLYSAEQQLVAALPKMAGAASSDELRNAFEMHLEQTREHVQRLDQLLPSVGITSPSETCEGMEGLLKEGEEIITMRGDPLAKDAALIAAAQRVEHYEIARYGTLIAWADELGRNDVVRLLTTNLNEEKAADKKLSTVALRKGVNRKAAS